MKPLTAEEIAELRWWLRDAELPLDTIRRLLDGMERSRALLKRIEWKDRGTCIECSNSSDEKHRDWCEFAALLGST